MREYTLSIIKPDATERGLVEEINKLFKENGLEIIKQKTKNLTREDAENFYAEHKERPFYKDLVEYMISGPVVVQVLAGDDAISKNREIMGATNPKDAAPGTIRALYGKSIDYNSVHGSDSPQSAVREINFFFDYNEIAE